MLCSVHLEVMISGIQFFEDVFNYLKISSNELKISSNELTISSNCSNLIILIIQKNYGYESFEDIFNSIKDIFNSFEDIFNSFEAKPLIHLQHLHYMVFDLKLLHIFSEHDETFKSHET